MQASAVEAATADIRNQLGSHGRIVVRASGTEPLLRVMLEGESYTEIAGLCDQFCRQVETILSDDWSEDAPNDDLLEPGAPNSVWVISAGQAEVASSPSVSAFG
jgi:hypothetical protein